ncbi:hypothetical protein FRB90_010881 [Tulasnella sp. 427]|nr:hypothetical protein FRB90_010881 [Tulasnella sp. 427]
MSTFLEPHPSIESLPPQQTIKVREWVPLQPPSASNSPTLKLMTWNMLAQTLIRPKIFPYNDCLRIHQRGALLPREVLTYNPDIACLQEVDRLDELLPFLWSAGYSYTYASGPQKPQGCMIIWKADAFHKLTKKSIFYDDEDVNSLLYGDDGKRPKRIASTTVTGNIGLIVALARKDDETKGYIVATTHTFWNPGFVYEKARQIGILVNTVRRLQASDERYRTWPTYLAGDFNSEPTTTPYSLLTAQPLTPAHAKSLSDSRVIHISRDPSIPPSPDVKEDEGSSAAPQPQAGNENDEDREQRIKNRGAYSNTYSTNRTIRESRRAVDSDDLLSVEELERLYGFEEGKGLRSGYAEALRVASAGAKDEVFGGRVHDTTAGVWEPMYTNYSFYWQATMDYIFILDPPGATSKTEILGMLKLHVKEDMEPGLPKAGISGSDHSSLMLELGMRVD